MSISGRIASRRAQIGLTQTELAQRAGLKPPAISQYESGARSPSYEALIKLSNALNVTTDYLISGEEVKSNIISDRTTKILMNIIKDMSAENKEKLLEYTLFLTNTHMASLGIPILNTATEYADYVYKKFGDGTLPVNVHEIASKLGILVYDGDLQGEYEGLLIKNNEKCVAILNKNINFEPRVKFTLSMLLGHVVIPWHSKSNYYVRKSGTSTLLTEEPQEIEAQKFAAYLLMPSTHFLKDLRKGRVSIKDVKEIADNKYKVSVTSFLNQMVDFSGERFGWVQSNMNKILKVYQGKRPIVENVNEMSVAYSFYSNPTPQQEEIREAQVPASYWFSDAKKGEMVFESSIFNPKYGNAMTLIESI